jgi:pimeloyl-ACP methyl ester carboxylesterase
MPTVRVGDIDINYEITDFTDPWIKPQTILLHHGFMRNLHWWYQWVPLLCRDYRVLAMDSRGCGKTTVPPESYRFTRDQMGDDAVGLLDALGLERVHWCGEGQGGRVGINVATRFPQRIASLILCNTPVKLPSATHNSVRDSSQWEQGVEHWARQTAPWRFDIERLPDGFLEWSIAEMAQTPPHIGKAADHMQDGGDGRAILMTIAAPTLVMAGGGSQVATADQVSEMKQLIAQVTVELFEGHGQGLADSNAEACARRMLAFLKSLPAIA